MDDESELSKDDLPRIVVEDDKIIVLEDSLWEERNVEGELIEEDEGAEEFSVEDLDLSEGDLSRALEEVVEAEASSVSKDIGEKDVAETYKVSDGARELYDPGKYDSGADSEDESAPVDYESPIDLTKIKSSAEIEEERKDRSTLEIAGFFDEEAKKKRERQRGW